MHVMFDNSPHDNLKREDSQNWKGKFGKKSILEPITQTSDNESFCK